MTSSEDEGDTDAVASRVQNTRIPGGVGEDIASGSDGEDVTWEGVLQSVQTEMGVIAGHSENPATDRTEGSKQSSKKTSKKRKLELQSAPQVENKSPLADSNLKRRRRR